MAAAASPLSIAATGLSGFKSVFSGLVGADQQQQQGAQTAQMDEFQAQRLADAQEFGLAQAGQTDAALRAQLANSLGRMMAIRASADTSASSPTGQAIAARTQAVGDQQRDITVGNLTAQAAESGKESQMYTTAAQQTLSDASSNSLSSIFGGLLGGAGSLLTGFSGLKIT